MLEKITRAEKEKAYPVAEAIFNSVKSRFTYKTDEEVWNRIEHWESYSQIPDTGPIEGDCDTFALACRKECRIWFVPSRLVFCRDLAWPKSYHLVLYVKGWILDNTCIKPADVDLLDYQWISISGLEPGDKWHRITAVK